MAPGALPDPLAVAVIVAQQLEKLHVRYVIGGSFASSLHGEPRSTNDVDIVADLEEATARLFVDSLGDPFYADVSAAIAAVRAGSSFNVVHIESAVKVDIFVAGADPFDQERLQRRQRIAVNAFGSDAALYVDTAEDVILRKLEWYRRGGETSERQWRDVLAVLRTQQPLDDNHLRTWADRLGVADLLIRARGDVKRGTP
ncbi:MAG: hypothetical protein ACJ796_05090 [Gemmatimonadaceae bacterium]